MELVGWLFWLLRPFETVFQTISGHLPKRGRKRREKIKKTKMSKQSPPALTAKQMEISLLEIGRQPKTALIMSLYVLKNQLHTCVCPFLYWNKSCVCQQKTPHQSSSQRLSMFRRYLSWLFRGSALQVFQMVLQSSHSRFL